MRLIDSDCPVKHEDMTRGEQIGFLPSTVGALAASQVAIWAEENVMRDAIREAGGLEKLIALVTSPMEDRRQAAFLGLSFLSTDNVTNCEAMFERGVVETLVENLSLPEGHIRASAETSLINVCINVGGRPRCCATWAGSTG